VLIARSGIWRSPCNRPNRVQQGQEGLRPPPRTAPRPRSSRSNPSKLKSKGAQSYRPEAYRIPTNPIASRRPRSLLRRAKRRIRRARGTSRYPAGTDGTSLCPSVPAENKAANLLQEGGCSTNRRVEETVRGCARRHLARGARRPAGHGLGRGEAGHRAGSRAIQSLGRGERRRLSVVAGVAALTRIQIEEDRSDGLVFGEVLRDDRLLLVMLGARSRVGRGNAVATARSSVSST